MDTIKRGAMVETGSVEDDTYDLGRVIKVIDAARVLVAWELAEETYEEPIDRLRLHDPLDDMGPE